VRHTGSHRSRRAAVFPTAKAVSDARLKGAVGRHLVEIAVGREGELAEVAAFYEECGYDGAIGASDMILLARVASQLVGVVRLCTEESVTVLRGMQVHRRYQRRGIGSQLLDACVPFLDARPSFCLPYSHLVSFYGAVSFEVAQPSQLPSFLAARFALYLAEGRDVLPMHRMIMKPYLAMQRFQSSGIG
jgi:GNAT superfamily N-acetyltransferase